MPETSPARPSPRPPRAGTRWLVVSVALHGTAFAAAAALSAAGGGSPGRPAHVGVAVTAAVPALAEDEVVEPAPVEVERPRDVLEEPPPPEVTVAFTAAAEPDAVPLVSDAERYPNARVAIGLGRTGPAPDAAEAADGLAAQSAPPAPPVRVAALPPAPPRPRGPSRAATFADEPPPPRYPDLARRRGWEGLAVVRVHVARDGAVAGVELVASSGRRLLDDAALDAARGWRFAPALDDGVAVRATVDVPVRFRLDP